MSKSVTHKDSYSISNPVDLIEETIVSEDWSYHRLTHDEIIFEIPGRWGDYRFQFIWQEEVKYLQFYCILDMRIQPKDLTNLHELIILINERVLLGNFEISPEEAMPAYRYTLLLLNVNMLTTDYLEELINTALLEAERFYPAFQLVIWGGKSAKEAAAVAMLETLGEA
jgi:hypothetical protein